MKKKEKREREREKERESLNFFVTTMTPLKGNNTTTY